MECNLYTLYIKKYRELRRMTQSELAFLIGKSQSYIAQLERPNIIRIKSPQLTDVITIANALDVCVNDLVHFSCNSCVRYSRCNRHQYSDEDDTYFKEHLDYYI